MASIVSNVERGLVEADPAGRSDYEANAGRLNGKLRGSLGHAVTVLGSACAFRTFVVTHEAFGYLASRSGLTQLGIEGIAPESEPTSDRIQAAGAAIASGSAGPAIFYEATDEGRRIGQSVASDIGVPALPLYTLEQPPETGDYLSAVERNLTNLREGLRCPS
jgi:zinc transport system substrate-binding protein